MNILVVDDDEGDIRMVSLALKQAHLEHSLASAETLAEGMSRLRMGGIDLVLLDLGLPDSHGLETVDSVCKAYGHIPIVVLTSLNSEEAGLKAIRRGASDYMIKDKLSADTLSRTIRYSLERKRLEQQLVYLANHDPLTGVLNRSTFKEAIVRAISHARRGRKSSLLMLDVDHFKRINDTLGHSAGDEVLLGITKQVQSQLRTEDILARVGGDEFAVILEGTSLPEARIVAERICSAVKERIEGSGLGLQTLSIGVMEIDGQLEYEALISRVDDGLYLAKDQGRDRAVCICQQEKCQPARRN